ncbi:MAG: hypothetical protein WCB79_11355 [Halobacteriota archaeon]
MQIFVTEDGKGYVVTYEAAPNDFDLHLLEAQEVIDSFTFT